MTAESDLSLPGVVATGRTLNARRMVHGLRAKQEEIAQEWALAVKTKEPEGKAAEDTEEQEDAAFDGIEPAS